MADYNKKTIEDIDVAGKTVSPVTVQLGKRDFRKLVNKPICNLVSNIVAKVYSILIDISLSHIGNVIQALLSLKIKGIIQNTCYIIHKNIVVFTIVFKLRKLIKFIN